MDKNIKIPLDVVVITLLSEYNRKLMNLKDKDTLIGLMDETSNKIIDAVNRFVIVKEK